MGQIIQKIYRVISFQQLLRQKIPTKVGVLLVMLCHNNVTFIINNYYDSHKQWCRKIVLSRGGIGFSHTGVNLPSLGGMEAIGPYPPKFLG